MWGWRVIRNGYRTTQGTQIGDTELDADKYQRDGHVLCPRRRYNQERWQNIIQAIIIKLQRLQWFTQRRVSLYPPCLGTDPKLHPYNYQKSSHFKSHSHALVKVHRPTSGHWNKTTRKYPRIYKQAPVFLLDGTLRTNPWDLLVTRCYFL